MALELYLLQSVWIGDDDDDDIVWAAKEINRLVVNHESREIRWLIIFQTLFMVGI